MSESRPTTSLDSLMMSCADLNAPRKGSSFKGPALKDVKVTKAQGPAFKPSTKARDWSSLSQNLEDAFILNSPKQQQAPAQPFAGFNPQPGLLQQHQQPVQPSPAQASNNDFDDWGDFTSASSVPAATTNHQHQAPPPSSLHQPAANNHAPSYPHLSAGLSNNNPSFSNGLSQTSLFPSQPKPVAAEDDDFSDFISAAPVPHQQQNNLSSALSSLQIEPLKPPSLPVNASASSHSNGNDMNGLPAFTGQTNASSVVNETVSKSNLNNSFADFSSGLSSAPTSNQQGLTNQPFTSGPLQPSSGPTSVDRYSNLGSLFGLGEPEKTEPTSLPPLFPDVEATSTTPAGVTSTAEADDDFGDFIETPSAARAAPTATFDPAPSSTLSELSFPQANSSAVSVTIPKNDIIGSTASTTKITSKSKPSLDFSSIASKLSSAPAPASKPPADLFSSMVAPPSSSDLSSLSLNPSGNMGNTSLFANPTPESSFKPLFPLDDPSPPPLKKEVTPAAPPPIVQNDFLGNPSSVSTFDPPVAPSLFPDAMEPPPMPISPEVKQQQPPSSSSSKTSDFDSAFMSQASQPPQSSSFVPWHSDSPPPPPDMGDDDDIDDDLPEFDNHEEDDYDITGLSNFKIPESAKPAKEPSPPKEIPSSFKLPEDSPAGNNEKPSSERANISEPPFRLASLEEKPPDNWDTPAVPPEEIQVLAESEPLPESVTDAIPAFESSLSEGLEKPDFQLFPEQDSEVTVPELQKPSFLPFPEIVEPLDGTGNDFGPLETPPEVLNALNNPDTSFPSFTAAISVSSRGDSDALSQALSDTSGSKKISLDSNLSQSETLASLQEMTPTPSEILGAIPKKLSTNSNPELAPTMAPESGTSSKKVSMDSNCSNPDKYSSLYELSSSPTPMSDSPFKEWKRTLKSTYVLLHTSAETFNDVANEPDVLKEIIDSEQGSEYLKCLREAYRIYLRIAKSYESFPPRLEFAQQCGEIERSWSLLVLQTKTPTVELSGEMTDGDIPIAAGVKNYCGLCLCDLLLKQTDSELDMNNATLSHGSFVYHSACANFWVNRVEPTLPDLTK